MTDMDTTKSKIGLRGSAPIDPDRLGQLAWEVERVAEADASIAAGYYATSAEVKAWIDSIGTDNPLPVPYPPHPRPL